jgi:GT2 family glycosyltransferase
LQYSCGNFPDWHLPFYRRTFLGKTTLGKKWLKNYLMMDWDHNQNKEVDWLFGACLLIRHQALTKVGLLDERFFLYLEDTDWCRRFWENNYQVVYFAQAKVIHYHRRSSAENTGLTGLFSRAGRIHLSSFIKYFLKYLGKPRPVKKLY